MHAKPQLLSTLLITALLHSGLSLAEDNDTVSDNKPSHHRENGFRNNYPHASHGFGDLLKWQSNTLFLTTKAVEFPLAQNHPEELKNNDKAATLTWIGHATFLIQIDGINILTDPHFTQRASPVSFAGPKRWVKPGLKLEELPHIDIVVISHNHYDHLDKPTLRDLVAQQPDKPPQFYVPLGVAELFSDMGIASVTEMDWWQQHQQQSVVITALPVQHFSGRSLSDTNETLWAGWLFAVSGQKIFFGGDTGYSKDFLDIYERIGAIDFALLPIGAYEPRWFMQAMHVNPEEAVQIFQDLRTRYAVGMHWGTFKLTDEDMDEPPKRLVTAREAAGIAAEQFFVMQHGETRSLDFLFDASATLPLQANQ